MPKFSVKKPFTVLVGVILVLVLGGVALYNMATDLLPNISLPYLIVVTAYPGASPEKVENDVTRPLESALGTVNGVENVSSTSSENSSMVMLEFAEDTDMDSAMVKASSAVNQLGDALPDMAATPILMEMSPDMLPTQYVAVDCEGMDIYELSAFAEERVIPAIERVGGVASVSATGLVERTVEITLQQDKIDSVNDRLLRTVSDRLDEALKTLEENETAMDAGAAALDRQQKDGADQLAEASLQLNEGLAKISALQVEMQTVEALQKALTQQLESIDQNQVQQDYTELNALLAVLPDDPALPHSAGELSDPDKLSALLAWAAGVFNVPTPAPSTEAPATPAPDAEPDSGEAPAPLPELPELPELPTPELPDLPTPELPELPTPELPTPEWTEEQRQVAGIFLEMGRTGIERILAEQQRLEDVMQQLGSAGESLSGLTDQMAGLQAGVDTLREYYKQLESGKITAAAGLGSAQAQLQMGQAQLESARAEYESAREQALESANLDQLLNMSTLAQILSAQNFSMPAGYVDSGDGQHTYLLKVGEPYESVDELAGTLLVSMEGLGDVYLRDVATIEVTDNADDAYAKMGQNQAVLLAIYKGSTASTSDVSRAANKAMAELEAQNPGLHLTPLMDQGDYIRLIVDSVMSNLVWGALLAIVVLALFLKDVRPTAVVAVSIPLSVLFAIVLMYFSNISLNMISLSGLALGIGMLVDNSIVVIENIYRLRAAGVPAARAAVQGARQVSGAIIASTATTVCVFLPIVFTEGLTRQLMMDMALTIGYSLLASLVVALTVVPCAGSTVLRKARDIRHPWFDRVIRGYDRLLRFCLRVKVVPLAVAVGLLVFSVWRVLNMGLVLIPDISSNQLSVTVNVDQDTHTKEEAYAIADAVMADITGVEGVGSAGAMSSAAAGSIMTGLGGGSGEDNYGGFTFYILMEDGTSRTQSQVKADIEAATADADAEVSVGSGTAMDLSALTGSGVEVNIYGDDLDTLRGIGDDVMALMGGIPGIVGPTTGQEEADTEVRVIVDKAKAMRFGLTVAQVYTELAAALTTESTSTTLTVGADTYTVEIIDTTKKPDLDSIFQYEFTTTATDENGAQTTETHTLGEFASRYDAPGVQSVARENQSRYLTVSSSTAAGYNTSLLARELSARLDTLEVPDGYTVELAGESTQVNEMLTQMGGMLALAFVLIYLVMVAQFQSLLSPFIVLFTVPLAFTGGMLGLLLSGEPLSLMSLMGFLVLMGVIVNNGIVFVDYTNQLRVGGLDRRTALVAAGRTRMRPILMTTLTTVLAMVVMLFSHDAGSEMGRGMAIVIVGGLLYATLMTLFIVPVVYDILFKKPPVNVDTGDDGMDDLPDDAAAFAAQLGGKLESAPAPAAPAKEDPFPDFPTGPA